MSEKVSAAERGLGSRSDESLEQALDFIRESLRGLRFGSIQVIVQDGVVVQVEKTERKRLGRER